MTGTRQKVLLIGAGSHARVLLDALSERDDVEVLGLTDPRLAVGERVSGCQVLGNDDFLLARFAPAGVVLVNAIGSVRCSGVRRQAFERFSDAGYRFLAVVHPRAIVSSGAAIDEGTQIMAGAVVQTGARVGRNAIVNTGAIVDHDCEVGSHVHVAPGATLSGNVRVGEGAHIGTGAVVIQGLRIGAAALIAAGAVVVKDVAADDRVMGVPARSRPPP